MNKDNWVVVISSYLKYSTAEHKVKSTDLDEFNVLNNSFLGLFGASKDFELFVIRDILIAVKELILSYEMLCKRNYAPLLSYLTALASINLSRFDEIHEHLGAFFSALGDSKNELVIKFTVDYLSFLANLAVREWVCERRANENGHGQRDVDFCMSVVAQLLSKKQPMLNAEALRIHENMVDKHGYELPASLWKLMLEQVGSVLTGSERGEVSPEVSKAGSLNSVQFDSEDSLELHFCV